jgi:hypothetical protein
VVSRIDSMQRSGLPNGDHHYSGFKGKAL